ncbi:MAG: tetratricopeptide repeat protein [Anaerolineales bacterium]|nr:MAG: tetratricopeptide repeat protein [Anaerolineales bacterium]
MAATNLRDYLQAIEHLIDSNQVEDALAHCRHVLKTFPKNIDTYRLMGKAYLESKRHSEASDLFQRVLSSIPDDFVAHIGMSIIREDEGHLDAAIWHMERAFESQPSNKAVQGEVRRLFGMREGYEPPKVRLTRGALARMYSHGDLYSQAIGELRNALAEDAQRPDLQTLLAEMYFKNNQHAEASEMCNQIIQKLPYCLYANRVMVDILRNAQRDVEANPYWERVEELDPYAAQVSTLKDVAQVPAESVMLEALELDSPMLLGAPARTAEAHEAAFEKEDLPDWLSVESADAQDEPAAEEGSVLSQLEGLEPEAGSAFMDELPDNMSSDQSPFRTGALQPDEIPDWLRELRPGSTPPAAALPPDEPPGKRWTEEFAQAGFNPTGPLNLEPQDEPEAEPSPPAAQHEEPTPSQPGGKPTGWLPTGELNWLDSGFNEDNEDEEQPAAEAAAATSGQAEPEVPQWLAELNENELEHTQPTRPVASAFTDAPAFIDPAGDETPEADEPVQEQAEPVKHPTEPAANWLNDLQASSGMQDDQDDSEADEPLAADADSTQRFDSLGWQDAEDAPVSEPPAGLAEPAESEAEAEDPQTTPADDEQDTLNWLEGLAARRGAAEEELLTDPEQRRTSKPEWLSAEQTAPTPTEAVPTPLSENLNWLDELAAAADPVDAATEEPTEEPAEREALSGLEVDSPFSQPDEAELADNEVEKTTPGWLRQFTGSLESADAPSEPIVPRQLDDAPDWLSELRPQDEPQPTGELQAEAAPDTEPESNEIPDWLSQLSREQDQAASLPPAAAQQPSTHSQDVPDWLRQLSEQEANGGTGGLPPAPPQPASEPAEASVEWPAEEAREDETAPPPAIEPTWVPASQLPDTPSAAQAAAEPPADLEAEDEEVEYETITFSGSTNQPVAEEPDEPEEVEAETDQTEYVSLAEEDGDDEDTYGGDVPYGGDAPHGENAPHEPEATPEPSQPAQPEPTSRIEPDPQLEPVVEPVATTEPAYAGASAAAVEPRRPARKRSRGLSPEEIDDRLAGARQALSYGNINDAAEAYSYFLRRRIRLDDVIADLRAASRRFPRQVAVWQTLGDAYMRNNELTEALDCYSRAKALL